MLIDLTWFLVLGGFVGLMAGLLGIGGGLILVPFLMETFLAHGHSLDLSMKLAIGTTLLTIVVTGMSSTYAHHRHQGVLWGIWQQLIVGVILGAIVGSLLVGVISGKALAFMVGIFALLAGIKMAFEWNPLPKGRLPGRFGMSCVGCGIGMISSLIGIGGGTLTVPFLVWAQISIRQAIATSAAVGVLIGLVGAIGFVVVGWSDHRLPEYSLGWTYLPAACAIALTSTLLAPVGAKLVHTLPVLLIKRIFAVLLLVVGVRLIMRFT